MHTHPPAADQATPVSDSTSQANPVGGRTYFVPDASPPFDVPGLTLPTLHERWMAAGKCMFRETKIFLPSEAAFKKSWNSRKREWLERGFQLRNDNGAWLLSQWLVSTPSGYALTRIGREKLEALGKPRDLGLPPEPPVILDLPELPESIASKLYSYQVEPARQLLRAVSEGRKEWGYSGAWDTSEMGTGKTFQSLAAALATGFDVAVVCPLAVIPAWKRAFAHFGAFPKFVRNYESLRTGNREWVKKESFINALGKPAKRFSWNMDPEETLIILDEAHNCKTAGSLNQNLLLAAVRQGFPLICCSGTMATDPTHMRATGRVVGLHKGGDDYATFLDNHNCTTNNGKDYKFRGGRSGREALARIHRAVFPKRGARVRIQELGEAFPETQIMAEAFETNETQAIKHAFEEAQEVIDRLAKQGASEGQVAMLKASAYLKAWHKSELAKIPTICSMVAQEMEAGRSVAIFVNFTDVREKLMAALNTRCAIFGGQPHHSREQAISDFQADRQRVIIANIDAGGVGISLHDINGDHPRTSIILPTNKVVSLSQALGRVHRAGGKSRSRQIVLFAAGTIEEQICTVIRRRMAQITTLNDGDLYPEDKF